MRLFLIMLLFLAACAHQPFPEGDVTNPHLEYLIYCIESHDPLFCGER